MLDRASGAAATGEERFAVPAVRYDAVVELLPARPSALLAPLSAAFDLAESQPQGHAVRVAHIAGTVAAHLGLDAATRRSVFYTALLHDAGVPVGELPGDVDPAGGHTAAGAWVASCFGLDQRIRDAIRSSHERWDGAGRPCGLAMNQVPVESLLVGAAHWACDIAEDSEHPLRARAQLQRTDARDLESMAGGRVTKALAEVLHEDTTWAAMWDVALASRLADATPGDGRASAENVERVAAAMGEVVDAATREAGRSRRVASLAVQLARRIGMPAEERRAIGVAAMLLDIGQLGIPRHIMEKPAILSVNEMERVRQHPQLGARMLESTPGMEEIAVWVAAHHERPDGRGYPEFLEGDQIPAASRVLALADSYWALRAVRPYRAAFSETEAMQIIEAGAGSQYDEDLVTLLPLALADGETRE